MKKLFPPPEEVVNPEDILQPLNDVLQGVALVCGSAKTQIEPLVQLAEATLTLLKVPYSVLDAVEKAVDAMLKGGGK